MTTARHLATLIVFFAASLFMGFYAGHMVDTRTDLAATIHSYTCEAGDAEINACVVLDTTQVTDVRDTIG